MFDNVRKKLGFGCMRLPRLGDGIDYEEMNKMVDAFMESGFNYFDTARIYMEERSELVLRECLAKRYPRESFILTDKLTDSCFKTQEEIRPLFESQLEACGVSYFDFYLMHSQSRQNFGYYKERKAYETALEFKAEGKIKHFGISFHDTADVLETILTEYPQIEVVQLQLNYIDYDDPAVQSKKCLEVCNKYGKPVIVMEPVKGGHLVNLPALAKAYFDELGGSPASYAIRFAAGQEGVFMVLSGMSNLEQMKDNISYMKDFKPLNAAEMNAVNKVLEVFKNMNLIACTACRYCVAGCPEKIAIPDLFACMNVKNVYHDWNTDYYYDIHTEFGGKASSCIECGKCEAVCPQHLNIRQLLKDVAKEFEK